MQIDKLMNLLRIIFPVRIYFALAVSRKQITSILHAGAVPRE